MPINAPVITSNGGGANATININEGITAVTTVVATDADGDGLTYKIIGGADRYKFKIDAATGALTFVAGPDFENPGDVGDNNIYDVIVQVTDGDLTDTQTIAVKVKNVNAVTLNGTTGNDTLGPSSATVEADTLKGLGGDDTLDGGAGGDTMIGGAGNDTYWVDNTADVTTEASGDGTDTVKSTITWTLSDNVEKLVLQGLAAINGTGNTLNNTLTGNAAANTLNGGTGADAMTGGAGNDTYVVDNAGDTVTEVDGEGTDTVQSSLTFTLANFFENLTLTGTGAINGTGNKLNNVITGNTAINTLTGGAGNDTLNGGGNADIMAGGAGNDIYVVDNAGDKTNESAGDGTDLVQSSVTFSLVTFTNVENLTLTGTAGNSATGNTLNNVLTGNTGANTLTGGDGNDTLNGGGGVDTMIGGAGDDKYTVDNASDVVTEGSNAGIDTVTASISYSIASLANIENVTLGGTASTATGNSGNNVITGNSSVNTLNGGDGNDTLNGMSGIDTMIGGTGNDSYYVSSAGETTTEAAGGGTDLVYSTLTWTLAANIENLTLQGSAATNGYGNTLDNVLTGNTAANTLEGLEGNDTLNGGRGNDQMIGGVGNDTYYVGEAGDVITELAGGGTDTVVTGFNGYVLVAEVENLTVDGTSSINVTGNSVANIINGNSGWNTLSGAAGNDTINGNAGADIIIGGAGFDTMTGGTEVDTFKFTSITDSGLVAGSRDSITDFQANELIDLSAIDAIASTSSVEDAFNFGPGANSTYEAGEIQVSQSGSVVTVSIYTDAVAGADMTFSVTLVSGVSALTADHFIL